MAATKKTKKTTEKGTKTGKVGRPRTKKTKVENADAVVDEFLNDACETIVVKEEPKVESVTVDVTIHKDGEVTGGTITKEQIDDLAESGVCVDYTEDQEHVNKLAEEIDEKLREQIKSKYANNAVSNPETETDVPDVEEIIREADEAIAQENVQEKPIEKKPKPKPKKRLTNRDVFGYDFMGVIYDY
jgi:hypothetical protein